MWDVDVGSSKLGNYIEDYEQLYDRMTEVL
jgi:hypothetical protein